MNSLFINIMITSQAPPQFNRRGSKIRGNDLTSNPMTKAQPFPTRLLLRSGSLLLSTALLLSGSLHAQLPVSRERHHKVIQENPYYRLLEGKIPAGDTTPAHVHGANSVVIFLSHSTFGIQVIGGKPVITTVTPGDIKYVAYGDKPVNHIVWNQTPPLFHFYDVELKRHPPAADSCPVLSQPGITLQWQQPSVKAYDL